MYLKFTRYDCKVQTKSVTCSIIPARSGRTEWIDRGNIRRHLPDIDATTASATTHCVPSCGSCTAGVSVCFGAAWPWDSTSRPPRRCSPCAGNCPDCGSAVAFPGQADRFPEADRLRYMRILDRADEVATLAPRYEPRCYLRRDEFMVERSAAVVAWFDGGKGGTRYTWDYARRCKAERINLWCDGQQELF